MEKRIIIIWCVLIEKYKSTIHKLIWKDLKSWRIYNTHLRVDDEIWRIIRVNEFIDKCKMIKELNDIRVILKSQWVYMKWLKIEKKYNFYWRVAD